MGGGHQGGGHQGGQGHQGGDQRNHQGGQHNNNRGQRKPTNMLGRQFDSSGPEGKVRGTAIQLYDRYKTAAREAQQADRVLSESFAQFAEHYYRLAAEYGAFEPENNPRRDFDRDENFGNSETGDQAQPALAGAANDAGEGRAAGGDMPSLEQPAVPDSQPSFLMSSGLEGLENQPALASPVAESGDASFSQPYSGREYSGREYSGRDNNRDNNRDTRPYQRDQRSDFRRENRSDQPYRSNQPRDNQSRDSQPRDNQPRGDQPYNRDVTAPRYADRSQTERAVSQPQPSAETPAVTSPVAPAVETAKPGVTVEIAPRRRGRPRKEDRPDAAETDPTTDGFTEASTPNFLSSPKTEVSRIDGLRRRRPAEKGPELPLDLSDGDDNSEPVVTDTAAATEDAAPAPRRRGRPRKNPV